MLPESLLHRGLQLLLPPLPLLPGERRSESAWSEDDSISRGAGSCSCAWLPDPHDSTLTLLGSDDRPSELFDPQLDGRDRTDGVEEEPPDGEPEPLRLSLELLEVPRRAATRGWCITSACCRKRPSQL